MDRLIPVISKLHDVFASIGSQSQLDLPQIVVVGSQSAGKSSVIEGIVGRDFLPRGVGIVTRRPLLLQLIHAPLDNSTMRNIGGHVQLGDWATFEHKQGAFYANFDMVRQEIERETDRLTGTNKGISSVPINLKIFSHKVVNLSLIDLPGITKVPIGDQPKDIEAQIRRMIVNYIKNPNSLILAVTPANQDFATSEPLKLARDVDQHGDRTLAVLTKLDLMDQGTDALDVLTGKLVPVKLGIIGIVNRSQADILSRKSIEECLKDEECFLRKKYPTLAAVNGVQYLSKTLNRLLVHHIRQCLPQLKQRISSMTVKCQAQLNSYGEPVEDKNRTLLRIITHFASAYTSTIEGTSKNVDMTELSGGARICYIFYSTFGVALDKIDPMHGLSDFEVLTAIRNSTGPRPALFVSEVTFELLAKRQIRRLQEPSLICADLVYDELRRIIKTCGSEVQQDMHRFPRLYDKISEVVSGLLLSRMAPTKEFIVNLVAIELAFINSRHPDFNGTRMASMCTDGSSNTFSQNGDAFQDGQDSEQSEGRRANCNDQYQSDQLALVKKKNKGFFWNFRKDTDAKENEMESNSLQNMGSFRKGNLFENQHIESDQQLNMTPRERNDCSLITSLIRSYFSVVRKSIQDMVPKTIMKFLVNHIRDNLQNELLRELYNSTDIANLLNESEQIGQKRKDQAEMLKALEKASAVISEIGDMNLW